MYWFCQPIGLVGGPVRAENSRRAVIAKDEGKGKFINMDGDEVLLEEYSTLSDAGLHT